MASPIQALVAEHQGYSIGAPPPMLKNIMQGKELDLRLELGLGRAEAEVWTCDLSEKYVTINARYHT